MSEFKGQISISDHIIFTLELTLQSDHETDSAP